MLRGVPNSIRLFIKLFLKRAYRKQAIDVEDERPRGAAAGRVPPPVTVPTVRWTQQDATLGIASVDGLADVLTNLDSVSFPDGDHFLHHE